MITHVRLGKIDPLLPTRELDATDLKILGNWRRWADALVILDRRLELIEVKLLQTPATIAQLLLYRQLLPDTPELAEFRAWPVELLIVCAIADPAATQLARQHGIRVIVEPPAWLDEWKDARDPRHRRAPRDLSTPGPAG